MRLQYPAGTSLPGLNGLLKEAMSVEKVAGPPGRAGPYPLRGRNSSHRALKKPVLLGPRLENYGED